MSKLVVWIVRIGGGILAMIDIIGFVSALLSIMSGRTDIVNLLYSLVVIILLPLLLNLTTFKLDDEGRLKLVVYSAYSVLLSLLLCGTYLITASALIQYQSVMFAGFQDGKSFEFSAFVPLASVLVVFFAALYVYRRYITDVPAAVMILASLPILAVFGWVLFKYIAFQELRILLQSASVTGTTGWVALSFIVVLTAIFISQGLRVLLSGDVQSIFAKA